MWIRRQIIWHAYLYGYNRDIETRLVTLNFAKIRKLVWVRDRYKCGYCGKGLYGQYMQWRQMQGKDVDPRDKIKRKNVELSVDHIVPKSLGGLDIPENLVTCCRKCNQEKGNQLFWKNK